MMATLTIALAIALVGGLVVVPAIEQQVQAKSLVGTCASSAKNSSAQFCHLSG